LIRWAETLHAKLIFLSSDQVFSGAKGGYRESDTPDPVSVYGRTKLEAEGRVLTSAARTLVIRCNSVVGPSIGWGESFTDFVLHRLRAGRSIELFEDQYRSPIHIRSLLDVLEAACVLEFSGLVHVGGPRRHSRLDVGYAVARAYGLSSDSIEVTRFREHPQAAAMTADNSYDISRLKQLMPFLRLRRLDDDLLADANAPEAAS
jgi:dTDP-4-dehydrorhamnose reductase